MIHVTQDEAGNLQQVIADSAHVTWTAGNRSGAWQLTVRVHGDQMHQITVSQESANFTPFILEGQNFELAVVPAVPK